jgi:hypothetical protein
MAQRTSHSPRLVPLLLDWFAANARDLPWRRTHDPYAIWVSEIMLQHMDDRFKPTWRWTTTRLMAEDSTQYVAHPF